MGIIKFNNVPSTTPGLEVETFPNYVAPEKEYQVTHVPGRNGDLVVDTKTYKNVPRSYKVSMAVEPPAVSVSGSTASFEATAERALAECKTAISSDVGKVGTTIINSATDPVENNEPYNFRAVPNGVGDRENDTLIGGTVAFNQLVQNGNFVSTSGWAVGGQANFTVSNNIANLTPTAQWGRIQQTNIPFITNHKYLVCFEIKGKPTTYSEINGTGRYLTGTDWNIFKKIIVGDSTKAQIITFGESGTSDFATINIKNVNIIDLTQMFGSTIADYIYGLETATARAGVAWFRNLFPKDYYAYNAGELISVKTEAHKTTGKNLLNINTVRAGDYNGTNLNIRVSQNVNDRIVVRYGKTYSIKLNTINNVKNVAIALTDDNNTLVASTLTSPFTPTQAQDGLRLTLIWIGEVVGGVWSNITTDDVKATDTQVELGSTATTYEPYEEHIYPLNPALELLGIPKLNSSNKLYYDGDIYSSDGSVIRKYGIVDLGSLSWTYDSTYQVFYTTDVKGLNYPSEFITINYDCFMGSSINSMPNMSGLLRTNALYLKNTSYSDATAFKNAMNGVYLIYELATPVIESTTGLIDNVSIASFDDGADNVPVNLLTSEIVAVQDLHGYDHPWPAGGGKNKLNYDIWKTTGITKGTAVWENNGVTLTATANDCYTLTSIDSKIPMSEGETITLSWEETTNKSGQIFIFPNGTTTGMVTVNNGAVKKVTYTATSGITFVTFRFGVANSGDTIAYKNIQIEKGNQATAYEPYSNICPITGFDSGVVSVCGVNLWDEEWESGKYNVTTGLKEPEANTIRSKNYIQIVPNKTYRFVNTGTDTYTRIVYCDISKNVISVINDTIHNGSEFTTPSNAFYLCFSMGSAYGTTYGNNISINYPSTDTQYHAYNGNTYTFTFGQTVYGGHFDNKGNLVVNFAFIEITGSENLYLDTAPNVVALANIPIPISQTNVDLLKPMSNIASYSTQGTGNFNNNEFGLRTTGIVYYKNTSCTTLNDFKTFFANNHLQICYKMANPITLSITSQDIPTLSGENNIFANTGNIKALSYPKQVCPFEPAQEIDDHGTEEYIDNREVVIPVGHESKYFTAGKIYNFSWLDEAGLIKEGELNADTGVLTITNGYGIVDLGDLTWTLSSSTAEYFSAPKSAISEGMIALSCSVYKVYTTDPSLDKSLFQTSNSIRIRDSSFFRSVSSSVVDPTFKSAMHGVKLLYELADPVRTIQLTPVQVESLIGHNVLISESGNISVTLRTYSTYTEKMNAISDWLHSASGYARLEDTYEPNYYRKAYYDEQTDMENIFNEAGQATLNFICKPQRYLKSGEEPITISSGGLIQNRTRYEAYPILKVTTNNTQGSVAIGNHSITIKAGAGTDPITIDCELQDAWSGTSNKNSYIVLTDGEFPVIDPGAQTVTFDGGVQSVEVIPRWWTV